MVKFMVKKQAMTPAETQQRYRDKQKRLAQEAAAKLEQERQEAEEAEERKREVSRKSSAKYRAKKKQAAMASNNPHPPTPPPPEPVLTPFGQSALFPINENMTAEERREILTQSRQRQHAAFMQESQGQREVSSNLQEVSSNLQQAGAREHMAEQAYLRSMGLAGPGRKRRG